MTCEFKKHFNLVLGLAIVGCTSTPSGYKSVPESDVFFKDQKIFDESCLKRAGGSLAGLLSINSVNLSQTVSPSNSLGSDLTFEGRWELNFSDFLGQILSPVGEPVVTLHLTPEKSAIDVSHDVKADTQGLETFKQFLSQLGPRNLRSVTCGSFAFVVPQKSVFQKNKSTQGLSSISENSEVSHYFTMNDFTTSAGKVSLKNNISTSGKGNTRIFEVKSDVVGGLFGKYNIGSITWLGNYKEGKLTPAEVYLKTPELYLKLFLTDFD